MAIPWTDNRHIGVILGFLATAWILAFPCAVLAVPEEGAPAPTAMAVSLTPAPGKSFAITDSVLARFEREVSSMSFRLERQEADWNRLAEKVQSLQAEAESLRRGGKGPANVIQEARLRGVLGELKRVLEKQAILEKQREELRRNHEEQSLSLVALYNDRIEGMLVSLKGFTDPQASETALDDLVRMARKRSAVQGRVEKLRRGIAPPSGVREPDLRTLPSDDRPSLLLARGFLQDRRTQLQEWLERSSLEEEEIKRQLELQDRMREWLADPAKGGLGDTARRNRLKSLAGDRERSRWENRLQEIRQRREKDQIQLLQVEHYLDTVEYRLQRLEKKSAGVQGGGSPGKTPVPRKPGKGGKP